MSVGASRFASFPTYKPVKGPFYFGTKSGFAKGVYYVRPVRDGVPREWLGTIRRTEAGWTATMGAGEPVLGPFPTRGGAAEALVADRQRLVQENMAVRAAAAPAPISLDLRRKVIRKQQPAPTEPGWYYGKPSGSAEIIPLLVARRDDGQCGYLLGDVTYWVRYATWFGPVDQVCEAYP
jgi:hypothetical protein